MQNCYIHMFSIKVEYKGKIINLGKSLNSIKKIENETKGRFPNDFEYGMVISYQDTILRDFQQIEQIVKQNNLISIKLKVNELSRQGMIQSSKISTIISNETSKINIDEEKSVLEKKEAVEEKKQFPKSEVKNQETLISTEVKIEKLQSYSEKDVKGQEKNDQIKVQNEKEKDEFESIRSKNSSIEKISEIKKSQNKIDYQKNDNKQKKRRKIFKSSSEDSLEGQVIPIYQSFQRYPLPKKQEKPESKPAYKCYECNNINKTQCKICDGAGEFPQDHKFVKFIEQIISNKMKTMLSQFGIKQMSPKSKILKPSEKEYNFQIVKSKIAKSAQVGEKVFWQFQIKNNGDDWLYPMEIIDQQTSSALVLGKLYGGRSKMMNVGPIVYNKPGTYEKLYRLCYFNKNGEIEYINKVFGFKILIEQPQKKKILTNNFRTKVQRIARELKSKHSIEFLVQKFRSIGFSQQNSSEINDELLRDAIRSFQGI